MYYTVSIVHRHQHGDDFANLQIKSYQSDLNLAPLCQTLSSKMHVGSAGEPPDYVPAQWSMTVLGRAAGPNHPHELQTLVGKPQDMPVPADISSTRLEK